MHCRFSTDIAILLRLERPRVVDGPRACAADGLDASGSALNDPEAACQARGGEPLGWNISDIGASLMGFTDVLSLR
jgi:hypothetical protein